MARNSIGPVTEDVIRGYLSLDLALYSMWMPGDITTASIQSTRLDPVRTYDEIIEYDDVHFACAAYLVRVGAPVFTKVKAHDAYTSELERRLRQGMPPETARDAALEATGALRREG
jgi:hypothetical protein